MEIKYTFSIEKRGIGKWFTRKNADYKIMNNDFKTEHNLMFEVADWHFDSEFKQFRVGTCEGLWRSTPSSYDILSIVNNSKGNGHLNDVIQWFEISCKRDKKDFKILELWNIKFKLKLKDVFGFIEHETEKDTVVKRFR